MENWPNTPTKINFLIMGLLSILFFAPVFADDDIEEVVVIRKCLVCRSSKCIKDPG